MPPVLPTAYTVRDVEISPNVVLAPMEGVTDLTFRRLVRQIGPVGLTCTEFIPSKGLLGLRKDSKAFAMAAFDDDEWPVSVQIYGKEPDVMAEAARIVEDLGATFCDINMGCPSKKVCKNSGGSALMRDLDLAVDIVRAVRSAISIPLTVKMRSGFDAETRNAPELAWRCQEEGVEGITIHWRTREDLYGGTRAIDKIREAKDRVAIPVVGNGDIIDPASAVAMFNDTGVDGVMVGRGAMRDPWCLRNIAEHMQGLPLTRPTPAERERVLLGYLEDCRRRARTDRGALGRFKKIANHFTTGLPHGRELLRMKVLRSQDPAEAIGHVQQYFRMLERWEGGEIRVFEDALGEVAAR